MTNKLYSAILAGTAALSIGLGATSANAATATGNSSATIVQALTINQDVILNFGTIVPAAAAATVQISTAGTKTCGAGLSCLTGTGAAGAFHVDGLAGAGITVSVSAPTTLTGAGSPMTLAALTTSGTNLTLTGGTAAFTVGGTLTVGANQAAGLYSGSYTVTANYQ